MVTDANQTPSEEPDLPLRYNRAQERFLGLLNLHPRSDAQAQPLEYILLTPQAQHLLLASLSCPGSVRSGPLFGTRTHGEAKITYAAPGISLALTPEVQDSAFALDERYVLGWIDSLTASGPQGVDWLGHWLIAPDNLLGGLDSHLNWLRAGQHTGLIDEDHFLLLLGRLDERVVHVAYLTHGNRAELLSVEVLRD